MKNKFIKNTGIYMISTAIYQAVPFLMLPILTIYLIPNDFGYINNFSAILMIINSILGGGLFSNIEKYYFRKDKLFIKRLMGNLYFLLLCSTLVIFLISVILTLIFNINFIPENIFISIPLISFFFVSFELFKTFLKTKKQVLFFSTVTISEVIFNIGISLFLVIGFLMQWKGRIYGMGLSCIVFGLFSLAYLIRKKFIDFSISKKMLGKILRLSLPLLPSAISVMIVRRSGILFIDTFQGKTEAGLYGVGLNLATIILFISMPLLFTWNPYIYEKLAKNRKIDSMILLRNKIFIFTVYIFSACILLSFFSGLILKIMTKESFYSAGIFIPWLGFGFAFWSIKLTYLPFFIHNNRQKYISLIAIFCAFLNIILNYFSVTKMGAIGIAVVFFISNFIEYLMVFILVRTFCKLPIIPDYKSIYIILTNLIK